MIRKRFRAFKGISAGDGLMIGLVALVMVLGGIAIFRSMDIQGRVATTFEGWYEDAAGYQKALTDQKQTQKPILLYFYATWCPHCKDFTAKVLSQPKTQAFVKNYPHVRVAPDNGEAEKKLMEDFGAQGYPTFYVIMPDQRRIQVDTYASTPTPHAKTAEEFIDSVEQTIKQ